MIRPGDIQPPTERLHALDACRAVAMLLGLYIHAALPHRPQAADTWPFADPAQSAAIAASVEVLHAFRMQVFFLLAGFFTALLIDRRGWRGMARNRALRIGIPYLFGLLVIAPACTAAWVWASGEWEYLTPASLAKSIGGSWHLWFLRELLIFCAAAAILAVAVPLPLLRRIASPIAAVALHPLGPLALAAVIMLTLLAQPWWGIHGPHGLPRWENLIHYGIFFALGAALWPRRIYVSTLGRSWHAWAAIGAVAAVAHFAVRGWFENMDDTDFAWIGDEPTAAAVAARAAYALMTAALVYAFLGLFLRAFARPSPTLRYVSDASYWVYLVHFPLILVLGRVVSPWPWPAGAKILAVLAVAAVVLFGTYAAFVRTTAIGRILNGPVARRSG